MYIKTAPEMETEALLNELFGKKMVASATINGRSYNTETARFVSHAVVSGKKPSDRNFHAMELYRINPGEDNEEFFFVHDYGTGRTKAAAPVVEPVSTKKAIDWASEWMLPQLYHNEFMIVKMRADGLFPLYYPRTRPSRWGNDEPAILHE